MKKRIEDNQLFADVLEADEQFRAATLDQGLAALRRTRARRRTVRLVAGTLLPLLVLAAMFTAQHWREKAPQFGRPELAQPAVAKTIEGTPIRIVSDEELLDIFKGRPVALVGQPGHQQLLLLDEKR